MAQKVVLTGGGETTLDRDHKSALDSASKVKGIERPACRIEKTMMPMALVQLYQILARVIQGNLGRKGEMLPGGVC